MKNISKSATKSLSKPSRVSVKHKARLSEMTAFSFGAQLNHLKTNKLYPFKRPIVTVFLLLVTSQNETAKSSLIPIPTTLFITMKWWPSPEGGIVLFRLLVAV